MFQQNDLFIEMLINYFTAGELITIFINKLGNWNLIKQILSNDYLWKSKCKQTFHSELFYKKFIEPEFHFVKNLQLTNENLPQHSLQNFKIDTSDYDPISLLFLENFVNDNDSIKVNKILIKFLLDLFSLIENFNDFFINLLNYRNSIDYTEIIVNLLQNNLQSTLQNNLQNSLQKEKITKINIKEYSTISFRINFQIRLIIIPFKIINFPNLEEDYNNNLNFLIEKSHTFSSFQTEYQIFNYTKDFTKIVNFINFNFLQYSLQQKMDFLEDQFELKDGKNKNNFRNFYENFCIKPNLNYLNYFYSVKSYFNKKFNKCVDRVLNLESLQQFLQQHLANNLKNNLEKKLENLKCLNKYLNNYPLQKEVDHLFNFDFTKSENFCNKNEIERIKIIYNYFYNCYKNNLQKKIKPQLYKNINYFFQKYLNLFIIFQYKIILTINGKEYLQNYSIHKVNKKNCKTLFFIYGIYLLPIIEKLIIFRIDHYNFLNKNFNKNCKNFEKILNEINLELKSVADNLLLYNIPKVYF
ncbi:hypothetical protein ABK040_009044 [Willaertia magna]